MQIRNDATAAAENHQKKLKVAYFWSLRPFKVINVGRLLDRTNTPYNQKLPHKAT